MAALIYVAILAPIIGCLVKGYRAGGKGGTG